MELNRKEIEKLYQELIIPESKQPYHFEKRVGDSVLAYNPVCGDKFRLYPEGMYFHGHGCALSKASGSLLMRHLENRTLPEAKEIVQQFISAVKLGVVEHNDELSVLVALKNFEGREDCILLTWKSMLGYLETKV